MRSDDVVLVWDGGFVGIVPESWETPWGVVDVVLVVVFVVFVVFGVDVVVGGDGDDHPLRWW